MTSEDDVPDLDDLDPDAFRAAVRAWLDEHAPAKGAPDDFSSVHVVSATSIEAYREREASAHATTCTWQRKLFDAGLTGRSWPVACGGAGAPEWQDAIVASEV